MKVVIVGVTRGCRQRIEYLSPFSCLAFIFIHPEMRLKIRVSGSIDRGLDMIAEFN